MDTMRDKPNAARPAGGAGRIGAALVIGIGLILLAAGVLLTFQYTAGRFAWEHEPLLFVVLHWRTGLAGLAGLTSGLIMVVCGWERLKGFRHA